MAKSIIPEPELTKISPQLIHNYLWSIPKAYYSTDQIYKLIGYNIYEMAAL